jgi:hypothetical protein
MFSRQQSVVDRWREFNNFNLHYMTPLVAHYMSLLWGGSETSDQHMTLFSVEIVCGIVVVILEGVRYEYTVTCP